MGAASDRMGTETLDRPQDGLQRVGGGRSIYVPARALRPQLEVDEADLLSADRHPGRLEYQDAIAASGGGQAKATGPTPIPLFVGGHGQGQRLITRERRGDRRRQLALGI